MRPRLKKLNKTPGFASALRKAYPLPLATLRSLCIRGAVRDEEINPEWWAWMASQTECDGEVYLVPRVSQSQGVTDVEGDLLVSPLWVARRALVMLGTHYSPEQMVRVGCGQPADWFKVDQSQLGPPVWVIMWPTRNRGLRDLLLELIKGRDCATADVRTIVSSVLVCAHEVVVSPAMGLVGLSGRL